MRRTVACGKPKCRALDSGARASGSISRAISSEGEARSSAGRAHGWMGQAQSLGRQAFGSMSRARCSARKARSSVIDASCSAAQAMSLERKALGSVVSIRSAMCLSRYVDDASVSRSLTTYGAVFGGKVGFRGCSGGIEPQLTASGPCGRASVSVWMSPISTCTQMGRLRVPVRAWRSRPASVRAVDVQPEKTALGRETGSPRARLRSACVWKLVLTLRVGRPHLTPSTGYTGVNIPVKFCLSS